MAGETTALVIFSPRSVFEELHGPAGSRLWRPGYLAALVEKHVPLWVVTPIAHAAKSIPNHEIIMCNPDLNMPLEANLFPFMASIFCSNDEELIAQAQYEQVLKFEDGANWIVDKTIEYSNGFDQQGEFDEDAYFDSIETIYPSSKLLELSIKLLSDNCRITSISYPGSAIGREGVAWMRSVGLDVDEFTLDRLIQDL